MSRSPQSREQPCIHCGTLLHAEVAFCFECGAPVVPMLVLPPAPGAPVSIRPQQSTTGLLPGETFEIESLGLEVVVEELDVDVEEGPVADPHGTVFAAAPERPMPFWPAPPKGETVVSAPPTRSRAAG